jgi:ectoine hydroxylase-related dioxygenase (phytanoyl-CoA dioxygenase family)
VARRAADAIDRNIAAPDFVGEFMSMRDQGFFNGAFLWLNDDDFRRFVVESPDAVIANQALGAPGATGVTFFYDHIFVKEPGGQVRTPWHHDLTFWPVEGSQVCSIWMPVDRVTKEASGL